MKFQVASNFYCAAVPIRGEYSLLLLGYQQKQLTIGPSGANLTFSVAPRHCWNFGRARAGRFDFDSNCCGKCIS
ncbi:hypothetical protein V3C99_016518 [Haemonchus contortus]